MKKIRDQKTEVKKMKRSTNNCQWDSFPLLINPKIALIPGAFAIYISALVDLEEIEASNEELKGYR